jgi:hypothetical protein
MPDYRSQQRSRLFIIALALALGSFAFRAPAAWAQDCVPASTPFIHAGDRVTVVATLSTSDPNENGEGETLVIQSSGGFTATVAAYEVPQSFTFTATQNGETLFGNLTDSDGDESCTLSVTVNGKQRLTDDEKDKLRRLSAELNTDAAGLAALAALCLALPDPSVTKGCALVLGVASGLTWFRSGRLGEMALDPPDPNFMVIASPVIPALPPVVAQPPVTPAVARAFNAFVQNGENIAALSGAILTCFNRAQGASGAGNAFWESRQIAAAQQYENQLGIFLNAEPALRAALQQALQAGGFPTFTPTADDVLAFEQSVQANGLPANIVSTLRALGASPGDIAQITKVAIVQDTSAAAKPFPASLTDPGLMADLHAAGGDFQAAGPCVANATTICLNNGRFAVSATFSTGSGQSGLAQAVPLTADTGYFWFFNSSNVEAVVKVINGCGLGGHFWVFAGGLTNVDTVVSVVDTKTGDVKTYSNTPSTPFQPIQDTSAFATCGAADTRAAREAWPGTDEKVLAERMAQETEKFVSALSPRSLVLNNNRFKVDVTWQTADGKSGTGTPVKLTSDTGYFWFFNSSNVELVVKVLNGCGLGKHYWVFAGGLTNVRAVITVTDTRTGKVQTYVNRQGIPFQPIQDTNAFATCP